MKGWTEKRLGDCVTFLSGGTPARDNPAYWGGDIPWASNKDMKVGRLHDTIEHISSEGAESSSRMIPANTLLLVVRGMALAKMLPIAITQRPMAFNQDLKALIPKPGISGAFLYYWFVANADYVLSKADEAAHGTKRLQTPTLEELTVLLPDERRHQDEIVEQIAVLDDHLENCERRITLLEESANLVFTEWFVRLRFPRRGIKSPTWPTQPLSSIANINTESLGRKFPWETLLYI
ncbi:MAG: restriction endonuclease subunit S, partial [Proteobacteria bacterium]|nr:restriction endonuclease subunit S [Pseudomonadota bacterium]